MENICSLFINRGTRDYIALPMSKYTENACESTHFYSSSNVFRKYLKN